MSQFILDCLDLVFFPVFSINEIVIVPFLLLCFVFIIRLFYSLIRLGAK